MSHISLHFSSAVSGRLAGVLYPDAPRLPISERIGGRWINDPYRWLEDPQDQQTVDWSQAQDELARRALDS